MLTIDKPRTSAEAHFFPLYHLPWEEWGYEVSNQGNKPMYYISNHDLDRINRIEGKTWQKALETFLAADLYRCVESPSAVVAILARSGRNRVFPVGLTNVPQESEMTASVARRLGELGQLGQDWDSYGGQPPTDAARRLAMRLFQDMVLEYGHRAQAPHAILPIPSGGVELEWRIGDQLTAVEIGPDGDFSYLVKTGRGPDRQSIERSGVSEAEIMQVILGAIGSTT